MWTFSTGTCAVIWKKKKSIQRNRKIAPDKEVFSRHLSYLALVFTTVTTWAQQQSLMNKRYFVLLQSSSLARLHQSTSVWWRHHSPNVWDCLYCTSDLVENAFIAIHPRDRRILGLCNKIQYQLHQLFMVHLRSRGRLCYFRSTNLSLHPWIHLGSGNSIFWFMRSRFWLCLE